MKYVIIFTSPFIAVVVVALCCLLICLIPFLFIVVIYNMYYNGGKISFKIPKKKIIRKKFNLDNLNF